MTPVVAFDEVSKWYGNVIGINKLTLEILAAWLCAQREFHVKTPEKE